MRRAFILCGIFAAFSGAGSLLAQPAAFVGMRADEKLLLTVHAEGVQIYECTSDGKGNFVWHFREPLATLLENGKTVGRHFAGPGWELSDGGAVFGKLAAQKPGLTEKDIPRLRLDVIRRAGEGKTLAATAVLRTDTKGGTFAGSCNAAGALHLEPYSADYAFIAPK